MSYAYDEALRQAILVRLAGFDLKPPPKENLRHAAVAIAVIEVEGKAAFLLTRRAPRMNAHAGQWALPGGRLDEGESAEEAALREMREEVNLGLPDAAILGRLDDYPTRSGYRITPVVVWAGPASALIANPAEVASIHRVPLSELDRPDSPEFADIPESDRPIIRLPIAYTVNTKVHAPTAAVLYQFREVALHGRPTRVDQFEQPVFAWK